MKHGFLVGLALLTSVLGGCVDYEDTWKGDASFTAEEREAIERGAEWLYRESGFPRPRRIEWGYSTEEATIKNAKHPSLPNDPKMGGGMCTPSGEIWLQSELRYLDGMAAHEMAHCELGFKDRYHAGEEKSDGIMRVLSPMRWTAEEDEQCALTSLCRRGK